MLWQCYPDRRIRYKVGDSPAKPTLMAAVTLDIAILCPSPSIWVFDTSCPHSAKKSVLALDHCLLAGVSEKFRGCLQLMLYIELDLPCRQVTQISSCHLMMMVALMVGWLSTSSPGLHERIYSC